MHPVGGGGGGWGERGGVEWGMGMAVGGWGGVSVCVCSHMWVIIVTSFLSLFISLSYKGRYLSLCQGVHLTLPADRPRKEVHVF